jgi:hypothetical protein
MDPASQFDVSVVAAAAAGWWGGKALVGWAQEAVEALGRRRRSGGGS